ncbi:MAG: hypothetical protein ABJA78_19275 [Ferruginibacter sp.]
MNKLKLIAAAIFFLLMACVNRDDIYKNGNKKKSEKEIPDTSTAGLPLMKDLTDVKDPVELLSQSWELGEDIDALQDATEKSGVRLSFRGFSFATDGSFVKDPRGYISFGKWDYDVDGKKLTLKFTDGKTNVYHIRNIMRDQLYVYAEGDKGEIFKYVADGMRYENTEDDPFYTANNQWRIAPAKPESDEAIRNRLKACIHFLILFHQDMIVKDAGLISFYGFPSCLKFYGPGIFMKKRKDIDGEWTGCFYNEEQAMKAYDMIDAVIAMKYDWTKPGSWLKKNESVLEQIYKKL